MSTHHRNIEMTGANMIVFGLWNVPKAICAVTVYNAIKGDYRHFDGASDYGNEKEAGEGVHRALSEGLVKRKDLTITSKLWATFHAKEHVRAEAERQLKAWGLKYFDSFTVHFPIALEYVDPEERYPPGWFGPDGKTVRLQNTPMQETWEAMESLVDDRLVEKIGISHCPGALLLDILRYARIQPTVLEVELHPYLTQHRLVALAERLKMTITAYMYLGPNDELLTDETITSIAKRLNVSPEEVLLYWAITPKTSAIIMSKTHLPSLKRPKISFTLTPEEMKRISALNRHLRTNDPADIDPRLSIFA